MSNQSGMNIEDFLQMNQSYYQDPNLLKKFIKIVSGYCIKCKTNNVEIRLISVCKPNAPFGADRQFQCLDCGEMELEIL